MSRTEGRYENAVAGPFFWSLKHEWTIHEVLADLEVARFSAFKRIETFLQFDEAAPSAETQKSQRVRNRANPVLAE